MGGKVDREPGEAVGAESTHVRRGLTSDKRIGSAFLFPGIGYGEPGEGYFRISLTYPDEVLQRAMARLAEQL